MSAYFESISGLTGTGFSTFNNIKYLVEYFDDFKENLSKYNLNSYIKSVSNL